MIYLTKYKPRKDSKYKNLKDDLVINAQKFYGGKEMIIKAFKDKIFPLHNPDGYSYYTEDKSSKRDSEKDDKSSANSFNRPLTELDEILDPGLVKTFW